MSFVRFFRRIKKTIICFRDCLTFSVFYEVANFRKNISTQLFIIFAVRSPVELPEVKKVAENVPNDVSHKPTMSGANRTQQVIVRNSSSIELQVSVPGIN